MAVRYVTIQVPYVLFIDSSYTHKSWVTFVQYCILMQFTHQIWQKVIPYVASFWFQLK